MSDANHTTDHDAPHEGPIKTPKQLIQAVLFAFLIPIIGIILLASYVAADKKPAAGSDGMKPEAVAQRIKPVAGPPDLKDLSDPSTMRSGEQVYTQQCAACHAAGALGAPKFADAGQWGPRLAQGYELLLTHAIKGKGSMPPQGSEGDAVQNFEVSRGLVYMVNHSGGKFPEPAAPGGAAAPAAGASSAAGVASGATAPAPAASAAAGASSPK